MTWAKVKDMQNLRHTCYRWSHYNLRIVSSHSVIHCGFGMATNLPECLGRGSHLMWLGDSTVDDLDLKLLCTVSRTDRGIGAKFGCAMRRSLFAIHEEKKGAVVILPPPSM